MTTEDEDREDLARHAWEVTRNESFKYGLFDAEDSVLLGCVYIDAAENFLTCSSDFDDEAFGDGPDDHLMTTLHRLAGRDAQGKLLSLT